MTVIPPFSLHDEIKAHKEEYLNALEQVLDSGQFVIGPFVEKFEKECAEYLSCKHAISLNSGTDALVIGLRSLGIGPGDEVIIPGFSFFSTAESVHLVGATPVFVDIRPDTFNIDPRKILDALSEKTKALIPVHLFGLSADMQTIEKIAQDNQLFVLEDAAQGFGATYNKRPCGSFGNAAAFSFYPTKNLGAFGDGGLLTTDSDEVAEMAKLLRNHGSPKRYEHVTVGTNSRLDAFQAAILSIRLRRMDELIEKRRKAAARYQELILLKLEATPNLCEQLLLPESFEDSKTYFHSFHQYTIRLKNRDAVASKLRDKNIIASIFYPSAFPDLALYKENKIYRTASIDECRKAAEEVLSLPLWPEISDVAQKQVVDALFDSF